MPGFRRRLPTSLRQSLVTWTSSSVFDLWSLKRAVSTKVISPNSYRVDDTWEPELVRYLARVGGNHASGLPEYAVCFGDEIVATCIAKSLWESTKVSEIDFIYEIFLDCLSMCHYHVVIILLQHLKPRYRGVLGLIARRGNSDCIRAIPRETILHTNKEDDIPMMMIECAVQVAKLQNIIAIAERWHIDIDQASETVRNRMPPIGVWPQWDSYLKTRVF